MLLFGLILLGPIVVLAMDHGVNPGSNLIFNFEQLRRDQPPQIEMRDESLGLYLHRRPQTTTTTIAPIVVPDIPKNPQNSDLRFSNPIPHVNNEYSYQYNPAPLPSTPIPVPRKQNQVQYAPWPSPPPAPQWSYLTEAFKKQGFPQYKSQKPFQNQPAVSDFIRVQQQQMTTPSVLQEQKMPVAPEFTQALHKPQPTTLSAQMVNQHKNDIRRNPVQSSYFHPTAAPVGKPITQATQHSASRGSHRFNWDDLTTQPSWSQTSQQVTTTTVRALAPKASGPHPIPTLTPWSDGF